MIASSEVKEGIRDILRTGLKDDVNSVANLRKFELELDCDVERGAGDTVNMPEETYFPMGNVNEKVRSDGR